MTELDRQSGAARHEADGAIGPEVPAEVREVVERSAALRRGLALLHRAHPETVASALGVHARAVDQARERLERREERRHLIGLYVQAASRRSGEEAVSVPAPRRGPDELIREAERHALGVDFLRDAHPEAVAVTFTVHPETVYRARELLAARVPRREGRATGAS